MRKVLVLVAFATLALAQEAQAQTNFQTFYDFGRNRDHFTTTLEGFYNDSWGNTFFFIDYDFNAKIGDAKNLVGGSYFEIARCLNFWQDSALKNFSAHVEYNGGVGFPSQNFLFGVDYFLHSADFRNTFNFKVLYKTFSKGTKSDLPMQFTFVWGLQDLFGVKGLRFSGFADFWGETAYAFAEEAASENYLKESKFTFLSEPQLWYNIGRHIGVDNFHIGGEVELSYNFAGYYGFAVRPCIGTKWVF